MSASPARLLIVESDFPEANSRLRLLEPPDSCPQLLRERLFAGTYDKPFIVDCGRWRFLHFDFNNIQSAMSLDHPNRLALAYTRKMMAFLLFNDQPSRILLLGLGGGSLAKFCYRRLPRTAVTTVEVSEDVIRLREQFRIPQDDERFRVIRGDAARYMARLQRSKDVILADACDRAGVAAELDDIDFYQHVWRHLSARGVFVANMCGDHSNFKTHLGKIRDVFDGRFVTLQVKPDGNVIVFAFKEPQPDVNRTQLEAKSVNLQRQFGLDFPRFARRISFAWTTHSPSPPP